MGYDYFKKTNIWKSNATEVKKILAMPQWNDEKYRGLLTSNIWKSSSKKVKEIDKQNHQLTFD